MFPARLLPQATKSNVVHPWTSPPASCAAFGTKHTLTLFLHPNVHLNGKNAENLEGYSRGCDSATCPGRNRLLVPQVEQQVSIR